MKKIFILPLCRLLKTVKTCFDGYVIKKRFLNTVKNEYGDNYKDVVSDETIAMCGLLHDVCKAEIYKRAIKRRKNEQGFWEDYEGYDVDYSNFPVGHGEKSVIVLLQAGLELTKEEILAIRWHMSAWDLPFQSYELMGSLNAAREKTPLIGILQAADGLAANVLETTK